MQDKPEAPGVEMNAYFRAFEMLGRFREVETAQGPSGPSVSFRQIKFADVLEYARAFPDDVDDVRVFVKTIHAIDAEFLANGTGQGKT